MRIVVYATLASTFRKECVSPRAKFDLNKHVYGRPAYKDATRTIFLTVLSTASHMLQEHLME